MKGTEPSQVWAAESDNDKLEDLAKKAGGKQEDWVCLWPVEGTRDNGYPSVKKCDKYSTENIAVGSGPKLYYRFFDLGMYDKLYSAIQKVSPTSVATRIKTASGEGNTPISYLFIAGHGGVGDDSQTKSFAVSDITDMDIEPSFQRALKKQGPVRCWFTRKAKVRVSGCDTMPVAQDFAESVLRKGAKAYGTTKSIITRQKGKIFTIIWFSDDNTVHEEEYFHASVWKTFEGVL